MSSSLIQLFRKVIQHRSTILSLALRDLKSKYAGSVGGVLWTLAHPIAIVVIYYFVFTIGFRVQAPGDTPFILWFVCGLVAWFFFNETLLSITNSITSNTHLVKKTIFPTEILPFVHLTSGLFSHFIFLFILAGMLYFFEIQFLASRIAVTYFILCNLVLVLSLGLILSALQVFYRDISHGLTITLNLLFWVTPIVWSPKIMPGEYQSLILYNPVNYIVQGYRGVLIYETTSWPSTSTTLYFWLVTSLILFAGSYMFCRLKPEFPDVI